MSGVQEIPQSTTTQLPAALFHFEDVGVDKQYKANVDALLRSVRKRYEPPPQLNVSQFADKEIIVTTGPLAGTHWQTDFAPYQRGIMDVFHEPGIEIAVVMGSSQWGKTAIAVNLVAYHVKHDPCPILIVEPTIDPMAKDFARNRLEPVFLASPALNEVVSKKRARDASNTTLQKSFRGGSLSIGGANSAASLAARSIRLLVLDEVDRYPAELPGEGNTLAIALKRTTAYRRRRRILMTSSPTLEGAPIHDWFQRGDQRRYFVPCPSCGCMHPYEWSNVRWADDDPNTARIHCPGCDHPINDAERVAILAKGEWRAGNPNRRDRRVVSFHLWEAYSPLSSLAEIVSGFLNAREKQKRGDKSEMHTWENTTLGEPNAPDQGDGVETHTLLLRREQYGTDVDLPLGACCLTMGVDTQDDRLELLVIGWGPGEESWIVDRQTLPGDTSQPEPWAMLDEVLDHEYRHESGQTLSVQATCIDSAGHRTTMVYDYAGRKAARRVFAIIGRDGERPIVSSPSPRKWGRQQRKVPLYTIGVDSAKALVVSRLGVVEKGAGFVHLPLADWVDEELCAQLTSERLVTKWQKGVPVHVWKKMRPRNEALDCAIYGLGALRLLHPNLDQLAQRMTAPKAPVDPNPEPKREKWVPRRRGWLRGDRS
jgi:phage terminase large subunit GpA-like protein